jgi:hypothetical protein
VGRERSIAALFLTLYCLLQQFFTVPGNKVVNILLPALHDMQPVFF